MDIFQQRLKSNIGITLSPNQVKMFAAYESLLIDWNTKFNLTAISDHQSVLIKHFYDSLTCLRIIPPKGNFSLIDVGTGAGFPGIPLKIINNSIDITLVESVGKKADFCKIVVKELHLTRSYVINSRAETIGQDRKFRESFDWAVARAVAPLSVLAEYLLPLVRLGGSVLAQKGSDCEAEISQIGRALQILGGNLESVTPISLPDSIGERTLIRINKTELSPVKYPRLPGTPKKYPLI